MNTIAPDKISYTKCLWVWATYTTIRTPTLTFSFKIRKNKALEIILQTNSTCIFHFILGCIKTPRNWTLSSFVSGRKQNAILYPLFKHKIQVLSLFKHTLFKAYQSSIAKLIFIVKYLTSIKLSEKLSNVLHLIQVEIISFNWINNYYDCWFVTERFLKCYNQRNRSNPFSKNTTCINIQFWQSLWNVNELKSFRNKLNLHFISKLIHRL